MAVKISGMMGTGSMGHNNRKFITENVDPARTEQNITLCRENLKQVYHELFDEALAEYNAKKTKTRDKIPDYYRHIEKSKQERLSMRSSSRSATRTTAAARRRRENGLRQLSKSLPRHFKNGTRTCGCSIRSFIWTRPRPTSI